MAMKKGKVVTRAGRLCQCAKCGRWYRNLGASQPHKNHVCSYACLDQR